jgi:hypothetical protein
VGDEEQKILADKSEGKDHLENLGTDGTVMDLKEIVRERVD